MTMADTVARFGAHALSTRWMVRAPIGIYRAGMGFVFGRRMLMLEHLGRRSGKRRYVVLEVVDRPAPGEYIIVSGFGAGAQWYRNILAHPGVRVWVGFRRAASATATPMSEPDSIAALEYYSQRHPRMWKHLRAAIERATGRPVGVLPMVRLRIDY
ncbi:MULTISPECIES: nitroreductase family deazaflavin-dependent oxidoreductase [unclassified Nocardia]|uniref:nitroreductase family deazaflavin-dependent oxidoreductase n=1 Tax=unclassified Nocardia TaxID=2637762 RepID=UPI001CE41314|nr:MULTISPECIES: nitroreductase family deazaflavin-dependent oxidoreductase [unclassified Nocardia]